MGVLLVIEAVRPLFPMGELVATPGAMALLEKRRLSPAKFLARHLSGDWGDLCLEDQELNREALKQGLRLMSSYTIGSSGETIWIITEADRSSTTILTPEEY